MTYPHYSEKYTENVCTGGLLEGSSRMVRIHPVPARYLEPAHRFKSYQWITCSMRKHEHDPRPESLRIDPDTIEVGAEIPATNAAERRRLIALSPHMCRSVEELHDRWDKYRVSLGIVKPKVILGSRLIQRPDTERDEWKAKEQELLSQTTMKFLRPPKPIDFPEVKFAIKWACDDDRCRGHEMGLEQWGIHELYRKLRTDPQREKKTLEAINKRIDADKKDVFFFLGNFRGTMWNFGLMDTFCCDHAIVEEKRPAQGDLFSRP